MATIRRVDAIVDILGMDKLAKDEIIIVDAIQSA